MRSESCYCERHKKELLCFEDFLKDGICLVYGDSRGEESQITRVGQSHTPGIGGRIRYPILIRCCCFLKKYLKEIVATEEILR